MNGALGFSKNQTVSCGQSSGVERAAAKVVKGKKPAILRQLCGNFGQPTPDRGSRLCAKPGRQPPLQRHGVTPALAKQSSAAAGQGPLQHAATHGMRGRPDGAVSGAAKNCLK
jgi:hypothetical protein